MQVSEPVEPVTAACTLWKGWQPIYNSQHVNAMGSMVEEHMPGVRFVCFTDIPAGIKFETHPLPKGPPLPGSRGRNCYRRMWFFSAECAAKFPGRIMNIDLDAVIFRDMWSLVSAHDFRILQARVCPYNGGFWLHRTGTLTKIWTELNVRNIRQMYRHRTARRWVGSDQKWLAHKLPGSALYTETDGVMYGHVPIKKPGTNEAENVRARLRDNAKIAFFPGGPGVKPWSDNARKLIPEVYEYYMGFYE